MKESWVNIHTDFLAVKTNVAEFVSLSESAYGNQQVATAIEIYHIVKSYSAMQAYSLIYFLKSSLSPDNVKREIKVHHQALDS